MSILILVNDPSETEAVYFLLPLICPSFPTNGIQMGKATLGSLGSNNAVIPCEHSHRNGF